MRSALSVTRFVSHMISLKNCGYNDAAIVMTSLYRALRLQPGINIIVLYDGWYIPLISKVGASLRRFPTMHGANGPSFVFLLRCLQHLQLVRSVCNTF